RLPDGSTIWDGIELDITERKRAEEALRSQEEALRESEVRYRRLVDLAPEAILVQQDNKIVYCNESAALLYGAGSPESLLGSGMFDRVHPEYLPSVLERIREAERGVRLPVREARHLRLDGSEVAVETTAGPVEWHGRPALLVFVRDITNRKLAEARLREAQKLESVGLLAGGVAHDFNNLLVGVIGNASLAQDLLSPNHPAAELLVDIVKNGEQAAHLTRQMLAYAGKGKFMVQRLDLSALLPEMAGLVRPSLSKKIELRLDLAPGLPPIEADRGQVQQVFMNLAINAAEAIGSHEGAITVRTGVKEIDEGYLALHPETGVPRPGKYIFLEVRDTGSGMDEATRARIFDPFFSTKFVGRGLGLAAVAGIVRGHNGAIAVSSTPGEGSCFTVLFPAVAGAAERRPEKVRDTSLRGSGTVMVVDDEPMVREMVRKALEREGYTVLAADSGLAAIDLCKRHPGEIGLVVLDLSMPHMGGEEALPEIVKIRPGVKVLVSSGYSESEAMSSFEGQRVSGFIQKPYTSKGIAEKVKDCLG
ncbi:MAG TPA: PAS domain S-box protein, partial [Bryobacteraceae bacterium]